MVDALKVDFFSTKYYDLNYLNELYGSFPPLELFENNIYFKELFDNEFNAEPLMCFKKKPIKSITIQNVQAFFNKFKFLKYNMIYTSEFMTWLICFFISSVKVKNGFIYADKDKFKHFTSVFELIHEDEGLFFVLFFFYLSSKLRLPRCFCEYFEKKASDIINNKNIDYASIHKLFSCPLYILKIKCKMLLDDVKFDKFINDVWEGKRNDIFKF